ncbi:MAG: hypothetical protein ACX94C_13570 [Phycisphaerales bacterium]
MQRGMNIAALAAVATCVSVASADTVTMRYSGNTGLHNIQISGTNNHNGPAGHLTHTFAGGGSFNTFCIELAQTTGGGNRVYDIVDLKDAPSPGASYGEDAANRVFAVLANAVDLNWIDINLQAVDGTSKEMAAIQGAIWQALYGGTVSSSNGPATNPGTVAYAIDELMDHTLSESNLLNTMANRVRAAVNSDTQDQLYVVPLPPAAWASLGLLGVCAGVRQARRRG